MVRPVLWREVASRIDEPVRSRFAERPDVQLFAQDIFAVAFRLRRRLVRHWLLRVGHLHRVVVRVLGHAAANGLRVACDLGRNSATHIWGYRNYETTDDSRNLWWVGLLAYGEGWHNNHHAYQRMAKHGHKWWEFDVTYKTICLLEKLGLAWNVVHEHPPHQKPA